MNLYCGVLCFRGGTYEIILTFLVFIWYKINYHLDPIIQFQTNILANSAVDFDISGFLF